MMKYFLFVLTSLVSMMAFSQHGIEVKRLSKWGSKYLTVTNNWNGFYVTAQEGDVPPLLAVVTEINGHQTAEMTPDDFYQILNEYSSVAIKYIHKVNGENKHFTSVLIPRKDYYIAGGMRAVAPLEKPDNIHIVSDPDVDFFQYNTFDFKVEGDDPLTDRSILQELSQVFVNRGMKRDTKNPDLIFTLKKTLQQTANSVYVPQTQQVVNTGSTTSLQRNLFTGKKYIATSQQNQVVTSGGYTHTGVSATLNLMFTILKNQNDSVLQEESSPVIWKLDYNVFSSSAIDIMNEAKTGISYWCMNYPFAEPTFSYGANTLGVVFKSEEALRTGEIVDVLEGTDAYVKGLRAGDKILKAYKGGYYCIIACSTRVIYFKADSDKEYFWTAVGSMIPFPFLPFRIRNKGYANEDYLSYDPFDGRQSLFKPHFIVRDANGKKRKIHAPFKTTTFNYEYIP